MYLMDVNVLVYAHREDIPNHLKYRKWLENVINSDLQYGYSTLVLSGFLRVVTHPKVFEDPSDLDDANAYISLIGKDLKSRILRISLPTFPLAPTTARLYFFIF